MKIGDTIPAFTLIGTDDRQHSPSDFTGKPTLLIITCNHCPHARAYVSRIRGIHEQFSDRVGFLAINPNDPVRYPEDSFDNMKPMAEALGINGFYLFDETQDVARALGAQRTPEAFLFDADGQLVYNGAIDDNEREPQQVTKRYLEDAISAVLSGQEVAVKETQPVGCSVKWRNG